MLLVLEKYNRESDNYFRMIYQENYQSAKLWEAEIKNHWAGFVEITAEGKNFLSAYTPIDADIEVRLKRLIIWHAKKRAALL